MKPLHTPVSGATVLTRERIPPRQYARGLLPDAGRGIKNVWSVRHGDGSSTGDWMGGLAPLSLTGKREGEGKLHDGYKIMREAGALHGVGDR